MALQILVENAIKHGISKYDDGGNISIITKKEAEGLKKSLEEAGAEVELK